MTHLAPPTEGQSALLEYAPRRHRGRRRAVRWAVAVLLLVGVGYAAYARVPLWAHLRLHWAQRQCAGYTAPADQIVATSPLLKNPVCLPEPAPWTDYLARMGTPAPPPPPRPGSQTIAFLHRRTSPAGHERIVAVTCATIYLASASVTQSLQARVVEPASFWAMSSQPRVTIGPLNAGYPTHEDVCLFAGQPDPADAARFTIAYTINGQPGTIDARLNDDDTVAMTVRDGSATWKTARQR